MPCDDCEKLNRDLAMVTNHIEVLTDFWKAVSDWPLRGGPYFDATISQAADKAELSMKALSQTADNPAWLEGKLREAKADGYDGANKIMARFFYAEPKAMKVYGLIETEAAALRKEAEEIK